MATAEEQKQAIAAKVRLMDQEIKHAVDFTASRHDPHGVVRAIRYLERAHQQAIHLREIFKDVQTLLSELQLCDAPADDEPGGK